MTEIKFFVLMRGALTPPPMMLTPVVWIPLHLFTNYFYTKTFTVLTLRLQQLRERQTDQCPLWPTCGAKCPQGTCNMLLESLTIKVFSSYQPKLTLSPFPVKTW